MVTPSRGANLLQLAVMAACTAVLLCAQISDASALRRAGRAPINRGCLTDGGAGQYVVELLFDDGALTSHGP
jgi:hypothetical protein